MGLSGGDGNGTSAGARMTFRAFKGGFVLAGLLFLVVPMAAQVQVGGVQLSNLTGLVGVGYSDSYGNVGGSDHFLGFNGEATLNGYYFNPKFLSFNVSPYYDESRANSPYRSVTDSSGVSASAAIFTGSHFAGSINFAKTYNSSGDFA